MPIIPLITDTEDNFERMATFSVSCKTGIQTWWRVTGNFIKQVAHLKSIKK